MASEMTSIEETEQQHLSAHKQGPWNEEKDRGVMTFKYQEIVTNTESFYIWGHVKTNSL